MNHLKLENAWKVVLITKLDRSQEEKKLDKIKKSENNLKKSLEFILTFLLTKVETQSASKSHVSEYKNKEQK